MLLHINSNLPFVHYTCPAIMFKCSYASSDCQNCLAGMACAALPGFTALAESLGSVSDKMRNHSEEFCFFLLFPEEFGAHLGSKMGIAEH